MLEESGRERLLHQIVMERSVGSLGSLLWKSQRGLPRHLKTRFCLDVAAGLEALHLIKIVHADVKSNNFFIFYTVANWFGNIPPLHVDRESLRFRICVPDTTALDLTVGARGIVLPLETLYEAPRPCAIVDDSRFPFLTIGDANVPSLQLSAEMMERLIPLSKVVWSTARRSPNTSMLQRMFVLCGMRYQRATRLSAPLLPAKLQSCYYGTTERCTGRCKGQRLGYASETTMHLRVLLKVRVDPRIVGNEVVTLHQVYGLSESFDIAVRVLVEVGADINAADDEGFTPPLRVSDVRGEE
ncbi:hypothetical protein EDD85DRAFT_948230 [Armillaria nabsnona]|nr:hypothetical protein EDD85DRAFT_948230 [Armillaria nabsnona]